MSPFESWSSVFLYCQLLGLLFFACFATWRWSRHWRVRTNIEPSTQRGWESLTQPKWGWTCMFGLLTGLPCSMIVRLAGHNPCQVLKSWAVSSITLISSIFSSCLFFFSYRSQWTVSRHVLTHNTSVSVPSLSHGCIVPYLYLRVFLFSED